MKCQQNLVTFEKLMPHLVAFLGDIVYLTYRPSPFSPFAIITDCLYVWDRYYSAPSLFLTLYFG